jgi:hypothetical protein
VGGCTYRAYEKRHIEPLDKRRVRRVQMLLELWLRRVPMWAVPQWAPQLLLVKISRSANKVVNLGVVLLSLFFAWEHGDASAVGAAALVHPLGAWALLPLLPSRSVFTVAPTLGTHRLSKGLGISAHLRLVAGQTNRGLAPAVEISLCGVLKSDDDEGAVQTRAV